MKKINEDIESSIGDLSELSAVKDRLSIKDKQFSVEDLKHLASATRLNVDTVKNKLIGKDELDSNRVGHDVSNRIALSAKVTDSLLNK